MTTTVDIDTILYAADQAGFDPETAIRENYSGRGMYGTECVGVTGSTAELVAFVVTLTTILNDNGDDADWVTNVRQDSMGLQTIWYWPGVTTN
jgi:hypothetical protein